MLSPSGSWPRQTVFLNNFTEVVTVAFAISVLLTADIAKMCTRKTNEKAFKVDFRDKNSHYKMCR